MRHVDDGTIHAWLDGQVTDRAEAAWIDEHLRWCATCAARLAGERSVLEQAHALLAAAAPPVEPPAFDGLVGRAAQQNDGNAASTGVAPFMRVGRLPQLAWAASLVLAAGLGWLARDVTSNDPGDVASVAEAPAISPATPVPVRRAPADVAGAPGEGAQAEAPPPEPPQAAAGAAQERMRRATRDAAAADVERPAASATASAAAASDSAPSTLARRMAAAGPPPATAPRAERAIPGGVQGGAASGPETAAFVTPVPEAVRTAPAPVAVTTAAPPETAGVQNGLLQARAASTASVGDAGGWRALPRTEAAARSGMALYGLDGLEPVLTAISPDDLTVRTVYPLPSGGTIELLQERASAPAAAAAAADSRARAARGQAGVVANLAPPPPRTWSEVRGDVRLSLRTASLAEDVNALAAKLKVE